MIKDMQSIKDLEFITDAEGRRIKAVLPIDEFEELMVDLGMAEAACQAKNEPTRPFAEFLAEMRADGEINV